MILRGTERGCLSLIVLLFLISALASAASSSKKSPKASYSAGDAIPVQCLNRSIDTGEHITDDQGQLQYIPFFTCNETSKPLELAFGVEKAINCTLPALTDPQFHLLEFYIHNDAPLTCRIPTHPLSSAESLDKSADASQPSSSGDNYIPLIFALSGTLQLSHLHVNPNLNVLLHTSPDLEDTDADIIGASAYSSPSLSSVSTRIVIGDPLPLRLFVHWYSSPILPPSTTVPQGLGGHVHFSTVVYCLVSFGVGVAASLAYFRGVVLPRRIKTYGKDRMGGERGIAGGYAFPGTGMVNMNGYGTGKRD